MTTPDPLEDGDFFQLLALYRDADPCDCRAYDKALDALQAYPRPFLKPPGPPAGEARVSHSIGPKTCSLSREESAEFLRLAAEHGVTLPPEFSASEPTPREVRREFVDADPPDQEALVALGREMVRRGSGREAVRQSEALMAAGWTFELPASPDPDVSSWYWRRPPRRKTGKGRFFWSTNQAFNAMTREKEARP